LIYIDAPRHHPQPVRFNGRAVKWCHLVSDSSLEELHDFAGRLSLKRSWFQGGRWPHYDLTQGKFRHALREGAVLVPTREIVEALRRLKGAAE
jgi:hypothetical protein